MNASPKPFQLARIGASVEVLAEGRGLLFTSSADGRLNSREAWPKDSIGAPLGVRTAMELEQLLELGYAQTVGPAVLIPYENFEAVDSFEVDIAHRWTGWSPFLLKIDRFSDIGRQDFEYRYEFLRGGMPVFLERVGYYVCRAGTKTVFCLDHQTFGLVEAMDAFNASGPAAKTRTSAWLNFAAIKKAAVDVGAALDVALQKNDVIVPSSLALSIVEDEHGRLTFLPRCPEVAESDFEHVFERNPEAESLYSLGGADGKRVRIVLTEKQQEVLRRMKSVRAVSGLRRESLKTNPAQVFDGVLDAVELPYGKRVIGIGDFEFVAIPRAGASQSGLAGLWTGGTPEPSTPLASGEHLDAAAQRSAPAMDEQRRPTALSQNKIDQADTPHDEGAPSRASEDPVPVQGRKKYLLIETNEEQVSEEWTAAALAAASAAAAATALERPSSLLAEIDLQPHQQDGVRWLQTCARVQKRAGVLLADDMGLGKTLQILSFIAWCIESGHFPELSGQAPPWRPVLVVVPLILLDNRTWQSEMEKFFANRGAIFSPIAALHGQGINRFKASRGEGREIELGKPVLDLDLLQRHRIVITNYDTLKNYQHSLAHFQNGKSLWSIVVTDEAQEYKIPNTKVSHAIKALKPDFHIACTGTPVENRLLDLWNLYDTVQPGLLHSAREFTAKYEQKVDSAERETALQELKERLLFQRPHAFLLRRNKSEVATLPAKYHHRLRCPMTSRDIEQHQSLIRALGGQKGRMSHLAVLQRLAQLYQHPSLMDEDAAEQPVSELIAASAKLARVCEELHRIREIGQKAIVFARHRVMQMILARCFEQEFRVPVRIINGLTKSSSQTERLNSGTRAAILDEFRNAKGFRVIVLSPFVAGIGLTITEANHVFHYGRWWNPAVESQATDRAYRIGQTREVHVYLPILFDPSGRISGSFDERLDQLMERKARLAEDFLRPLEGEDDIAEQLYSELSQEAMATSGDTPAANPVDLQDAAFVACCLEGAGYSIAKIQKGYGHGIELVARNGSTMLAIRAAELPEDPKDATAGLFQLRAAADSYSSATGRHIVPAVSSCAPATLFRTLESQRIRQLTPADLGLPATAPTSADVAIRAGLPALSMQEALSLLLAHTEGGTLPAEDCSTAYNSDFFVDPECSQPLVR